MAFARWGIGRKPGLFRDPRIASSSVVARVLGTGVTTLSKAHNALEDSGDSRKFMEY